MCPGCMAAAAVLIASAVSTGGVVAVLADKLRLEKIATKMFPRGHGEKK